MRDIIEAMLYRPGLILVVYLCLAAQAMILVRLGVRMAAGARRDPLTDGAHVPATGPYTTEELRLAREYLELAATTKPSQGVFTAAQIAETAEAMRVLRRASLEIQQRRDAEATPQAISRRTTGWLLILAGGTLIAASTFLAMKTWRLMASGRTVIDEHRRREQ